MASDKVVLVVASTGYQPIEYGQPKKLLEDAGLIVVTASDELTATAKDDTTTTVDLLIDQINLSDIAGIFFIGGPGALEHLDNPTSHKLIEQAARASLPMGAICISVRILAQAGALKGKQATGWDGDGQLGQIYANHGVIYTKKDVVVDGNIITAVGPSAAKEFGSKIIEMLQDNKAWG